MSESLAALALLVVLASLFRTARQVREYLVLVTVILIVLRF
jgi:hypothetical protein